MSCVQLDSSSSASDKSVITTVPQLSTASLVAVACSLTAGRLFVLLSNSHVHVWELHLMRPPSFLVCVFLTYSSVQSHIISQCLTLLLISQS